MSEHKKRSLRDAMATGGMMIYIDATKASGLPEQHHKDTHLALALGYDLPIPTDDFRADDDAIRVTLSFNRVPHLLVIPYAALNALKCVEFYTRWSETLAPVAASKPTGLRLVTK